MKKLLIAAGLLAVGATTASADPWHKDRHPYAQHHHAMCQEKAHRLFEFERRAARDGHIDRRERAIMHELQRDLDQTCGKYRWHG